METVKLFKKFWKEIFPTQWERWERQRQIRIGRAFRKLLGCLPSELRDPGRYFSEFRGEDLEMMRRYDVQAGLPFSREFARFGVTPPMVIYAGDAVSTLIDRIRRYENALPEKLCIGKAGEKEQAPETGVIPLQQIVREVSRMCDCGYNLAQELFDWLLRVAGHKPCVIPIDISEEPLRIIEDAAWLQRRNHFWFDN